MTREEAIKVLSNYDVNGVWVDVDGKPYNAEEQAEAFDMAIEAIKLTFENDTEIKSCSKDSDLINRANAIEAIENVDWHHQNSNKDLIHGANSDEHQAWYKADDVYKALEAVPSADRPRGEWIDENGTYYANCSKCGYQMDTHVERGYFRYCPNCGADMRGDTK